MAVGGPLLPNDSPKQKEKGKGANENAKEENLLRNLL